MHRPLLPTLFLAAALAAQTAPPAAPAAPAVPDDLAQRAGKLALFVAAALAAQTAPPAAPAAPAVPDDLAQLAAKVAKSHRPGDDAPPVVAFQGSLEIDLVAADAKQGGQVALHVQFLRWQRPDSTRIRDLIGYEITQAGEPILRGRDSNGYWHLFGGQARDLQGADFATDLQNAERDTNLARQLLQCLDPAAMLLALQKPSAVRETTLQLGREPAVACHSVVGNLPSFPLLQQGGDGAPVQVEVFVTRQEHQLLALSLWPLVEGNPERSRGELVRLRDLHLRDGLLVPRRIEHFFRNEQGNLKLQSRTAVVDLQLRPKLDAKMFDRETLVKAAQQRRRK